jgi:iron complex transport system permease protein
VLLQLRLPRVALASLAGATLAVAGASLQGLMRNPLADPGLIGVSSGAAVGAATMIVLGAGGVAAGAAAVWWLPAGAFAGALLATACAFALGSAAGGGTTGLLLAGIAINAAAGAALGGFQYVADDAQLRNLSFWTLGSVGGASPATLTVAALAMTPATAALLRLAPGLNALALGERAARDLGVDATRLKAAVVLLCAFGVGTATALCGIIGFVGLVVPHLIRLVLGPDHRRLLPAAAIAGATLLTLADLVARTCAVPAEVPVGILTAALGVPLFAALLLGGRTGLPR